MVVSLAVRLRLLEPEPVMGWLDAAGIEVRKDAPITVLDPRTGAGSVEGRCLAVLPLLRADPDVARPDVEAWSSFTADAYAGDERTTIAALRWLAEAAEERHDGPLRMIFLGGLGTRRTATPIGTTLSLEAARTIGRGKLCDLCLRQGAHSDQNIVARVHARLTPTEGGVRVEDFGSTRGTWVDGALIEGPRVVPPGTTLAIAGCLRVRIDGQPGRAPSAPGRP